MKVSVKQSTMNSTGNSILEQVDLAGVHTPVSKDEAKRIVRNYFGFAGEFKRFESEKDDTFLVTKTENEKFVLKIANTTEKIKEIEMQQSILRHIESFDPSLPVPRVINNINGDDIFQINDASGTSRNVRMLTFIEGIPLCSTHSNTAGRQKVGQMLSRLQAATKDFSHNAADRYYAWDVQNLLTLEPLLDWVDNPTHRSALINGLSRFQLVYPLLKQCRKQVVHNDFSKSNIIVNHKEANFVKGIIDFGDTVKTAIAVDVSTALLNQLPEKPNENLFGHGFNLMEGYMSLSSLTDTELEIIPHLVMGRVIARALITHWRKSLFPENENYIMRNTERGWHQLDWFLARTREHISDTFLQFSS